MPNLNYNETIEEIKSLQKKIKEHQDNKAVLKDYVDCLKRLQFLRNSLRALKGRKVVKDENE